MRPRGRSSASAGSLRATATLTDETKKGRRTVVATGLTLVRDVHRRTATSVGITVWNGSTLVFSSDWTGSATRERALEHGRVIIR